MTPSGVSARILAFAARFHAPCKATKRQSTGARSPAQRITASGDRDVGHGDDELASPPAELALLRQNFGGEVPGEQQDIVRPALDERTRRQDRQMDARREAALLEIAAIDHEVDQLAL